MNPIRPWQILSSHPLNHYRIFKTRADRVVSPRNQREYEVTSLEVPHWVNVLAYTPEGKMVLTEQYRHGIQKVILEIPGGCIDPGEEPAAAGARELLEETGYAGDPPILLGKVHPNPAFQTNFCHTVLVTNVHRVKDLQLDEMEDIAVRLASETEFEQMILDGRITNALVLAADLWRRLWRQGALKIQD
ncbi:MAG: NUDIX hydrolase [Verrucomicrobiae bacterium]|nr:NUDIX hydrolase [Verrucomicrobiae bacterium]